MTRTTWFVIAIAAFLAIAYEVMWHIYGRQIVTPIAAGPYWRAVNLAPIPWYQDPHVLVQLWCVGAAVSVLEAAVLYYRRSPSASERKTAPLFLLSACAFLTIVADQLLLDAHAPLWLITVVSATVVPSLAIFWKLISRPSD